MDGVTHTLLLLQTELSSLHTYGQTHTRAVAAAAAAHIAAKKSRMEEKHKVTAMQQQLAAVHGRKETLEMEIRGMAPKQQQVATKKAAVAHRKHVAAQEWKQQQQWTEEHKKEAAVAAAAAAKLGREKEKEVEEGREALERAEEAVKEKKIGLAAVLGRVEEQQLAKREREGAREERRVLLQQKEKESEEKKKRVRVLVKEKEEIINKRTKAETGREEARAEAGESIHDEGWMARLVAYENELATRKTYLVQRQQRLSFAERELAWLRTMARMVEEEEGAVAALAAAAASAEGEEEEGGEEGGREGGEARTLVKEALARLARAMEKVRKVGLLKGEGEEGEEGKEEGGDGREGVSMEEAERVLIKKRDELRAVLGMERGGEEAGQQEQEQEQEQQLQLQLQLQQQQFEEEMKALQASLERQEGKVNRRAAAVAAVRGELEEREGEITRLKDLQKAREEVLRKRIEEKLAEERREARRVQEERKTGLEQAYLEADRKFIALDEELKEMYAGKMEEVMEIERELRRQLHQRGQQQRMQQQRPQQEQQHQQKKKKETNVRGPGKLKWVDRGGMGRNEGGKRVQLKTKKKREEEMYGKKQQQV